MTNDEQPARPRTLRIGSGEIALDWKFWWAAVLAAIIIIIGFATNQENPWSGALVAFSTVIGTLLGVALQFRPAPTDHSARAEGAIHQLHSIALSTADANTLVRSALERTKEVRTQGTLLSVQMDLTQVVENLQVSMVQWDGVAPGSLRAFEAERGRGRELLERMTRGDEQ